MCRYIFIFAFLFSACRQKNEKTISEYKELVYTKGDCIAFKIDSAVYGTAAIIDISKDDGGLWYALCFLDYADTIIPSIDRIKKSNLSGRKVESGIDAKGYMVGVDIEYVHEKCIRINKDKTKLIGNLNFKLIEVVAEGASKTYHQLITAYKIGKENRSLPPDNYRDHIRKMEKFRPQEYLPISDFTYEGNYNNKIYR